MLYNLTLKEALSRKAIIVVSNWEGAKSRVTSFKAFHRASSGLYMFCS